MAKKKEKKKGKKAKATVKQKTEEDVFLEQLTLIVAARLKEEKWDVADAEMKKKLTSKEKSRLASRRAEELKQAVEVERLRLIEEEKKRQELERQAAMEKEQRDTVEQEIRLEQLRDSCTQIRELQQQWLAQEEENILQAEWEQYIKCDGLPDPSNCGEMNTYLHLWDKIKENTTPELACQKTNEVLKLLDILDNFMDSPCISNFRKENWLTVRNEFRRYQCYNLDCLAYGLFRDIYRRMERLNIPTARQVIVHPEKIFTICVWALVQLPIPVENPKRPPRSATKLNFEEISLEVSFPEELDVWAMCIRAMFLTYDHFSHRTMSYHLPVVPDELRQDLLSVTVHEWTEKINMIQNKRNHIKTERDKAAKQALALAQASDKEDDITAAQTAVRKQKEYIKVDGSALYLSVEDQEYAAYRQQMLTVVPDHVINLRKYRIIGGIFFLDLFYQPPQPTTMVLSEITLATLQIPKWLSTVPFHYKFEPPPPPPPGVVRKPEEIEEELKKVEAEYEQLLQINLKLSNFVLWMDPPSVCQWDEELVAWSTKDIHDVKFNEEKLTMQFKTGRFGPFSMMVYRYNCMPFQAWELRPGEKDQVTLHIITSVLIFEFTISGSKISLTQLQNAPSAALDHLIGQWYSLPRLRRLLRRGGADIFPAPDAFCYLEGVGEKQWPLEHHLYYNMAQCSLYFNFAWSRWNLLAGRRNIVMQMREWSTKDRNKQPNYSMLMVTPLKALLVDCTEVSQTFNEEGIRKMKFYPDLYHLILGTTTITMKCKLKKMPADLINTVAQLLNSIRVLSLS